MMREHLCQHPPSCFSSTENGFRHLRTSEKRWYRELLPLKWIMKLPIAYDGNCESEKKR